MEPSIKHFTHPGHVLREVYGSEEFHCNGCEIPGLGPRYRCHDCDYNLHKYCGVCPSTLSTFMHPQHGLLKLMPHDFKRICNLCGDDVEGMFYHCTVCDFNIHPVCTTLPEDVSYPHPLHPTCQILKLHTTSSGGRCDLCKTDCTSSWVYGCRICGFDIHLRCILAPGEGDNPTTRSRSVAAPPYPYSSAPYPYGSAPSPTPSVIHGGGMPPYNAYWLSFTPFGAYAYHQPLPSFVMLPSPSGFYSQFDPHGMNNQTQGGGRPYKWKLSRIISALVGHVSMGVLSNVIAEGITG